VRGWGEGSAARGQGRGAWGARWGAWHTGACGRTTRHAGGCWLAGASISYWKPWAPISLTICIYVCVVNSIQRMPSATDGCWVSSVNHQITRFSFGGVKLVILQSICPFCILIHLTVSPDCRASRRRRPSSAAPLHRPRHADRLVVLPPF
jgi:hypothetical protein